MNRYKVYYARLSRDVVIEADTYFIESCGAVTFCKSADEFETIYRKTLAADRWSEITLIEED